MPNQAQLEQAAHLRALRQLAKRNAVPEDTAIALYEHERLLLGEGASVTRFVGILAEKRAKSALRQMKQ